MRIYFKGLTEFLGWRSAYVDVKDEAELTRLRVVTDGVAPLERISRWKSNDKLTGIMPNFCLVPNCRVCGGGRKT